jgi:hypothetical protein
MTKKQIAQENSFVKPELTTIAYKSDNHKKELFVSLYNQLMGHVSNTCAAVPISRDTYYRWLEEDAEFRKAIMESEMNLNDEIRDVLINKAASGDMTAVIFYLKKRHPDFKEQPTTLIQNNFGEHAKKELEEFTDV